MLWPAAPAARADGDPGSDVLIYQNLMVAVIAIAVCKTIRATVTATNPPASQVPGIASGGRRPP